MLFIPSNSRLSIATELVLKIFRRIIITSTYLLHDLQYTEYLTNRNNLLSLELSALTMLEPPDSGHNLVARTEQHINYQIDKLREPRATQTVRCLDLDRPEFYRVGARLIQLQMAMVTWWKLYVHSL